MSKNIAIVPARGGSKSIPLKNIKIINGKPLIYWNLEALENSNSIDKVFVATDSNEIKEVVNSFNFSKIEIYNRKSENAQDTSSTESVILECIEELNLNLGDNLILVQVTSPLTQSEDFDNAIYKFKNNNFDSLLTCVRIKRFFWNEDGTPINYDYLNRPRRQDFKGTLVENGAFYISKVENILKSQCRISGNIGIYEMREETFLEIDEPIDFEIIEKIMKTKN